MGDPSRNRKKFNSPGHPYQRTRLESELVLVGKYGLRNKRELWRARTKLRNYRAQARSLLALEEEQRKQLEQFLIEKLVKLGVITVDTDTDDILGLEVESILKRRLQTRILEKGLAGTIHQARQLITHRHIAVSGRIMTSPSYIVRVAEDDEITYSATSPFNKTDHPMMTSLSREVGILEIPEKRSVRRR